MLYYLSLLTHTDQLAVFRRQIGHFLDVFVPDHAAKAGVIGLVDQDHAEARALVNQFPAGLLAKFTGSHDYTSTRSMPPLFALATKSGSQFSPSR